MRLVPCLAVFVLVSALSTVSAATATLEDLAWIAGHWKGDVRGAVIEEHWSQPAGGSMMGMFRYVKDGKAGFLEFMTIETTGDGPMLRLRHFDPGLIAWEDKDNPLSFRLLQHRNGEAVFESTGTSKPARLIFRRDAPDSLTITLEKERDGKKTSQPFRYKRSGS